MQAVLLCGRVLRQALWHSKYVWRAMVLERRLWTVAAVVGSCEDVVLIDQKALPHSAARGTACQKTQRVNLSAG